MIFVSMELEPGTGVHCDPVGRVVVVGLAHDSISLSNV